MSACVVFLGPSLSHKAARKVVGDACELRPPIKRGDLPSLSETTALVAIIDGVFQSESAVGHREILDLLRKGVKVVGGGSMGALRAAELDTLGMVGIGTVYQLYAGGKIDGDDEVALIFNPENLEALSEPLVNMRHNLEKARERSVICVEEENALLTRMKALFYPKRTKEKLIEVAKATLEPSKLSEFEKFLKNDYVDIKMNDAVEVLRYLINTTKLIEKSTKI